MSKTSLCVNRKIGHLRATYVSFLSEVQSRFPRRKVVFIKDPDGNLLEFNWGDTPSEVK